MRGLYWSRRVNLPSKSLKEIRHNFDIIFSSHRTKVSAQCLLCIGLTSPKCSTSITFRTTKPVQNHPLSTIRTWIGYLDAWFVQFHNHSLKSSPHIDQHSTAINFDRSQTGTGSTQLTCPNRKFVNTSRHTDTRPRYTFLAAHASAFDEIGYRCTILRGMRKKKPKTNINVSQMWNKVNWIRISPNQGLPRYCYPMRMFWLCYQA